MTSEFERRRDVMIHASLELRQLRRKQRMIPDIMFEARTAEAMNRAIQEHSKQTQLILSGLDEQALRQAMAEIILIMVQNRFTMYPLGDDSAILIYAREGKKMFSLTSNLPDEDQVFFQRFASHGERLMNEHNLKNWLAVARRPGHTPLIKKGG